MMTVSDLPRSLSFYRDILGFRLEVSWDKGAYLTAGTLWFCLNLGKPSPAQDYSHLALTVDAEAYEHWQQRLAAAEVSFWQTSTSEGDSLYLLDPDGHKLELHVGDLQSRLQSLRHKPYAGLVWHG